MCSKKENDVEKLPGTVYDGRFYEKVGDFQRAAYLGEGYTQGTVQEVDFLQELLQLPPGARILDVGCGAGRHSLELARRGFHTLGVDIAAGLVEHAQKVANAERLTAEFQIGDARTLTFGAEFDAAVCLCEGAFGLAGDDDGHRRILAGVSRALKPGALFVLTAINAFSAAHNEDTVNQFDPYTATSSWHQTFHNPEGEAREFEMYCTAFTHRELRWLLGDAGFEVRAAYGCVAGQFERKPLELGDVEIMMVARQQE